MTALALLLIGFSIFSAITLALTHFTAAQYHDQTLSRTMGLLLLLVLSGLQISHFSWLYFDREWIIMAPYNMTLFVAAPAFFLFAQPLIRPQASLPTRVSLLGHALPIVIAPFLLSHELSLPLAFIVGSGYLFWLARGLFALRHERANFRIELILLGTVFALAVAVSVLGLTQTSLPDKLFFSLYAIAIGLAFFLVQTTLGLRPQLSTEVIESAQTTYAVSTLSNINCDVTLEKLAELMRNEQIYTDSKLSLSYLSQRLELNTHQLSELINTQLGKSFSRYLREHRIAAAKVVLRDEPTTSVLSIGLSVGYSSQSNFYQAFREIEGMTPGQYRKLQK